MKRAAVVVLFLLSVFPARAWAVSVTEFQSVLDDLRRMNSKNYRTSADFVAAFRPKLQELRDIKTITTDYGVSNIDFSWVVEILDHPDLQVGSIPTENLDNLINTLTILKEDLATVPAKSRSADEVNRALQKVDKHVLRIGSAHIIVTGDHEKIHPTYRYVWRDPIFAVRRAQVAYSSPLWLTSSTTVSKSGCSQSGLRTVVATRTTSLPCPSSSTSPKKVKTFSSEGIQSNPSGSTASVLPSTVSKSPVTTRPFAPSFPTPVSWPQLPQVRLPQVRLPQVQLPQVQLPQPGPLQTKSLGPKVEVQPLSFQFVAYAIFAAMFAIVLVASAFYFYRAFRNAKKELAEEEEEEQRKTLSPFRLPTGTGVKGLLDYAKEAAAQQNYREAIRLATLATLCLLEKHNFITFKEMLTNGEILHNLLTTPEIRDLLREPLQIFNAFIYGSSAPDENDFRVFVQLYETLEERVCQ